MDIMAVCSMKIPQKTIKKKYVQKKCLSDKDLKQKRHNLSILVKHRCGIRLQIRHQHRHIIDHFDANSNTIIASKHWQLSARDILTIVYTIIVFHSMSRIWIDLRSTAEFY